MNRKSIKAQLDRAYDTRLKARQNIIATLLVVGSILSFGILAAPTAVAAIEGKEILTAAIATAPLGVAVGVIREEANDPASGDAPSTGAGEAPEAPESAEEPEAPEAPEANDPPNPNADEGDSGGGGIFAMARQFLGLPAPGQNADEGNEGPTVEELTGQLSQANEQIDDLTNQLAEANDKAKAFAEKVVELEKAEQTTSQAAAAIAASNHVPAAQTPAAAGSEDPVGAEGISSELGDLKSAGGPQLSAFIRKNEESIREAARLEALASQN